MQTLIENGYELVSGGTENHLVLVNLKSKVREDGFNLTLFFSEQPNKRQFPRADKMHKREHLSFASSYHEQKKKKINIPSSLFPSGRE